MFTILKEKKFISKRHLVVSFFCIISDTLKKKSSKYLLKQRYGYGFLFLFHLTKFESDLASNPFGHFYSSKSASPYSDSDRNWEKFAASKSAEKSSKIDIRLEIESNN